MARQVLIKFRRDTAANWTSANPTLAAGEPGFETNTGKVKIGDGSTAWNALAYTGVGFANPMTTQGDLIIENATPAPARLPIGSTGQVLTVSGGLPAWQTPSSSGTGLVKLFDSTLGANAASIDTGAGGIAGGYGSLVIEIIARATTAAITVQSLVMRLNNDSGANYDYLWMRNSAGTIGSVSGFAQTQAGIGQMPGAGATANYFSPMIVSIPAYDQTTAFKAGTCQTGVAEDSLANSQIVSASFTWRNTAAITRIAIFPADGSNLVAGSRMTIFGTG